MPNLRHRQERVGHLRSQAREGISRLRIFDPRLWVSFHAINGRTAANPTRPALLTRRAPLPGAQEWDEFYGTSVDPYDVQTSTSVKSRYETTLRALGDRRFSRALEVGCGEGVLTELVAPRCDELLAVDVSQVAVERARQRMAGRTGVTVERRTLPEEVPPGPFDLILCSEVLYYWERERLLTGLRAFELMLPPVAGSSRCIGGAIRLHTPCRASGCIVC
jgi:SAM-dependent methyltransferase